MQFTTKWMASDAYDFAIACVRDDKSLEFSLVRHWLSLEDSSASKPKPELIYHIPPSASVDLWIRELRTETWSYDFPPRI